VLKLPASTVTTPRVHHLDRFALDLACGVAVGDPDELLNTKLVAGLIHVSTQWLEIARSGGYGPPFVRLSPRIVRYRRRDLIDWLRSRSAKAVVR
jgi:hypothetical protein